MNRQDHIMGCILGTAVGDAIGLPREGLSARRAERMFGGAPLTHRFILGRGMCSDDTEHTLMVGLASLESMGDPEKFAKAFARRLRWWFARIPAGVGLGTAKACIRLWFGVSPGRSGVRSAGNGPAMRSALLGLVASSEQHVQELVQASTAVTHTDPRARDGALVIARLVRWIATEPALRATIETPLVSGLEDMQLCDSLMLALEAARDGIGQKDFAIRIGQPKGISGFVNHTVPAAVYCWLSNRGSFRDAVETAVCLGGDSDTVAAITGALAGTEQGSQAIPDEWLSNLREWPCSVEWMTSLAEALTQQNAGGSPSGPQYPAMLALFRNVMFTAVVLSHGLRRLLPPY
ncbi:MAG: ADP-ribosylglycohydrolase family protein [Planctomycetota bacterium]